MRRGERGRADRKRGGWLETSMKARRSWEERAELGERGEKRRR